MTLRSSTVRRRALPRVSWGRAGVYPLLAVITFILLALAALAFAWSGSLSAWRLGPPWTPSNPGGTILLESSPDGARVEVDAQNQGSTPVRVAVSPGTHHVALRLEGYMPTSASVHVEENAVTTVSTHLWLATARGQRVRAVFPGAVISQASFLGDGNLALILQLPSAGGREVWVADPSGQVRRVGPVSAVGSVAASSDGKQVAYLNGKASGDLGGQRLGEVWVVEAGGEGLRELYELPTSTTDYRLSDLSWTPDGKRLLLVSREQTSGESNSTHFVSLDVSTGATDEVLAIPSEVVEGSLAWSPDGKHVAFLTRSGGAGGSTISLCLLDVSTGDFRYLADLGRDDQGSLPFVPLSWSPDGQSFVYSAPEEGATQSPSLSVAPSSGAE